jgi:hypothetical protein
MEDTHYDNNDVDNNDGSILAPEYFRRPPTEFCEHCPRATGDVYAWTTGWFEECWCVRCLCEKVGPHPVVLKCRNPKCNPVCVGLELEHDHKYLRHVVNREGEEVMPAKYDPDRCEATCGCGSVFATPSWLFANGYPEAAVILASRRRTGFKIICRMLRRFEPLSLVELYTVAAEIIRQCHPYKAYQLQANQSKVDVWIRSIDPWHLRKLLDRRWRGVGFDDAAVLFTERVMQARRDAITELIMIAGAGCVDRNIAVKIANMTFV